MREKVLPDIVGAQGGEGALLNGGRTLGYYNTIAASYGLQAGVQKHADSNAIRSLRAHEELA